MLKFDLPYSFVDDTEKEVANKFLTDGYIIIKVEDIALLDCLRDKLIDFVRDYLSLDKTYPPEYLLNNISNFVEKDVLNQFRLHIIQAINSENWFRPAYFKLAKKYLNMLVGNELVMQRKLNLSIQLPKDNSSLLNLHADTWSGDSPFEIVTWLPFVDCYKTKAMYILPPSAAKELHDEFSTYTDISSEELYTKVKDKVIWIEVPYGNFLLFNQSLPHGNRINKENETRWSMNCRFKSVFTPYVSKNIGEFFEPITLKAMSEIGMSYKLPVINK